MPDPVRPPISVPGKAPAAHGSHVSISGHALIGGHGIWAWEQAIAVWTLVEDKSRPGYVPGPGPTEPGRFHGQTIRRASILVVEEVVEIE